MVSAYKMKEPNIFNIVLLLLLLFGYIILTRL